MRGEEKQFGGTIHSRKLTRVEICLRKIFRQIHFARDLHPLTGNVEERDGPNRQSAGSETRRVVFPARAERGHNARAGDDDAR